jgi:DNA-binding GntR family transcriptional regulator
MKPNDNIQIDRKSFEPAYMQLVNILRRRIADGVYRSGSQLPPESELIDHFGVSSMTVRRAINLLIDQGVVTTIQGKGTFVKPMEMRNFSFQLSNLTSLFSDKDRNSIKILNAKMSVADEMIASKLSINPGERTLFIKRLIYHDKEPIMLHIANLVYQPCHRIVESEMEVTSLHGLFTGTDKTEFKKGEFAIEAYVIKDEEAKLLMVPDSSPAFKLVHTFYDFEDHAVSWGSFLCRGDKLRFTSKVGIWD